VIGVSELAGRSEISQPEISTRRTWLGHPVGLVNLFGVELWERFSLYFFSVGLGTAMSGVLARYYDPAHEFAYFGIIGSVAVVIGAVVWVLAPRISALMDGVH
jgi:dipeptide/tripeptide permease